MRQSVLIRMLTCTAAIAGLAIGHPAAGQTPEAPSTATVDMAALKGEADRLHAAKDYAALLPVMEKLVAAGDAQAANNLAVMYGNGMGIAEDERRALGLYRLSAEKGYAPAQAVIGYGYLYGRWDKPDLAEAKRWCTLAADQREAEGLICLARMHANGLGFPENKAIATSLLEKAVALDSTEAMWMLGMAQLHGDGVTKSEAKGIALLKMAANMGNVDAMLELGSAYRLGENAPLDEPAARGWYQKATDGGHVGAQVNLALMLVEGMGGDADPARAFTLMKGAAEQGDIAAQMNLATMYEEGKGTNADPFAAHQWLYEALRHPDIDEMEKATIEFRLACLCHGLNKAMMAKAKAASPMPKGTAVASRR